MNGAVSGILLPRGNPYRRSRLLVRSRYTILDKLLALAKTAKMGNPLSLDTQVARPPRARNTRRCCPILTRQE